MERTYSFDELLGSLRRRWKRAAIVAGVVFALAALVIARLPNQYTARALVMVEPLHPHPDLVTPVLAPLEDRVKSVRAQIYARGTMAVVIDELHLYQRERAKAGMDGAVEVMRNDVEVRPEGDTAFAITVKSKDPALAATIANRLAELFIEGNLQVRAGQVARTRDLISSKLAELRAQLNAGEKKVAEFKGSHQGALPELMESMMRERDQLSKQIEMEAGFMTDAQKRLDLIGTLPFGKDTEVGRLEDEEAGIKAKYAAAAATLKADHPDLQELQREVANIHGRLTAARASAASNTLDQMRIQKAIDRSRHSIDGLNNRIASLDSRMSLVPGNAARLAELSTETDVLKAKVTQLVSKKAEAELAYDMEHNEASSEFRVLESAAMPTLPANPNRPLFLLLAFVAAVGLGFASAAAQEMSDRTLRNEAEAGFAVSLPILASVPRILETRSSGAVLALPPVR